ncbi:MAG: Npt1/Npt2 family nucleotide transporter [Waddliaceae bacterium]
MSNESSQNKELKKTVLSLSVVSFFLAFNYFILAALKETLLVTAPEAGAEAIPFVKMWLLFPFSVAFLAGFTWMASTLSFRFAVSTMIILFLSLYAVFAFICYPLRETLHLHGLADNLQLLLPEGWKGFATVVRYWSFSLFYVSAECWCTIVYSVVFWGYANAVIKLAEAKKYYPYLTLAGTIAALIAGPLTIFLTGEAFRPLVPLGYDKWEVAFYGLTFSVLLSGFSALTVFLKYCPAVTPDKSGGEKSSFRTSFLKIFRSKYLITLAGICLTYNLVINLTDVVWKNEVLKLYPNPGDFTSYLSFVTVLTGIVSTFITLFVCRQSLRWYGWTFTALITPFLALITGAIFFLSLFGQEYGFLPISLTAVTFLGSIHICLSCGAKYTLFEPTKEMAFIPLSNEEKLHGKAAIDGIGTRLGKTSSSIIYQSLLVALPTISACTPIIGALLILVIAACISCILSLGKQIEAQPLKA